MIYLDRSKAPKDLADRLLPEGLLRSARNSNKADFAADCGKFVSGGNRLDSNSENAGKSRKRPVTAVLAAWPRMRRFYGAAEAGGNPDRENSRRRRPSWGSEASSSSQDITTLSRIREFRRPCDRSHRQLRKE
jgi:hypothetical protein